MKTTETTSMPASPTRGTSPTPTRVSGKPGRAHPTPARTGPRSLLPLGFTTIMVLAAGVQAQISSANEFGPDHWIAIGDGIRGANGEVVDLVTDETGNLYVAGNFTVIGDVVANGIAKWDGQAWSALGSGMDDQVITLAVSGTDLYAGGVFTRAGGVEASMVAKWDGTSWSGLGEGLDGMAFVLVTSGTDLCAGGNFTTAGGSVVNNIAKWDGTQWSPLGTGVDGRVTTILVSGADVYTAGLFTSAGGVAVNRVAKWDGVQWSALGDGLADRVNDLVLWESDLYAAGRGSVHKVSKWDGVAWTTVASSDSGEIGRFPWLATSGGGLLVVSYRFNDQEDITETILSRWVGDAWQSTLIDTSRPASFSGNAAFVLPAVSVSADSLYFANNALMAGAQRYVLQRTWGLQGKVSPLVSRFFLGSVPPLELDGGRTAIFFREDPDQTKGVLPGRVHRIDRTTDLETWETPGHRYAGETGGIDFTDPDAPGGQAFYRAVPR